MFCSVKDLCISSFSLPKPSSACFGSSCLPNVCQNLVRTWGTSCSSAIPANACDRQPEASNASIRSVEREVWRQLWRAPAIAKATFRNLRERPLPQR
jgi:hypothetical protein